RYPVRTLFNKRMLKHLYVFSHQEQHHEQTSEYYPVNSKPFKPGSVQQRDKRFYGNHSDKQSHNISENQQPHFFACKSEPLSIKVIKLFNSGGKHCGNSEKK